MDLPKGEGHLTPGVRDFIRQIVEEDLATGRHERVLTRFPPEPNGYLHIGHAKAICLDFGVAEEVGGRTTLRMDDTNPTTEDPRFVESIAEDVRWLGFEWSGEIRYASDYFGALYRLAVQLIEDGFAYVDDLTEEEIREYRGTVTEAGVPSPHRDRSVEENLELFRRMRAGEFPDGSRVLRARIDLASPNMKMRDPPLYRIRHAHHYRTGGAWPIYPMYDWAHGQSDAIEGITHSFCTLEFENNRELYDWCLDHTRPSAARLTDVPGAEGGGGSEPGSWDPRPRQYEFARLSLDYTIVSKRKLKTLVEGAHVTGWDDPRMPTLAGLRRRGVPPAAIRRFCDEIGVSRADNRIDIRTLEYAIRDELNPVAPRVMCVSRPLKVVLENYPEDHTEWLDADYFPRDVESPPGDWPATRSVPFTRALYMERDDFSADPPPGFRRLAPGREVRLRYGYFIQCQDFVEDPDTGRITELRCTYDPETRGGAAPDGRKPSGTIHWVSAARGAPAELRMYDRLFAVPDPSAGVDDWLDNLNPDSVETLAGVIEPAALEAPAETPLQFERLGYFIRDPIDGAAGRPAFNRTVPLRDSWSTRGEAAATSTPGDAGADDGAGAGGAVAVGGAPDAGDAITPAEHALARDRAPDEQARFTRYHGEIGLDPVTADVLAGEPAAAALFEAAFEAHSDAEAVSNWLVHELRGAAGGALADLRFGGAELGRLIELVDSGEVSQSAGKRVLEILVAEGGQPDELIDREGLRALDAARVAQLVEDTLESHPDERGRYRGGEEKLIGFFVGQVMRKSSGRADAREVKRLLVDRLESG